MPRFPKSLLFLPARLLRAPALRIGLLGLALVALAAIVVPGRASLVDGDDDAGTWLSLPDRDSLSALALAFGGQRLYRADLLFQVERPERIRMPWLDAPGRASGELHKVPGPLSDAASNPLSAEVELLRSRLVLGRAVENVRAHVDAEPVRLPWIGTLLARGAAAPAPPVLAWFGGFVHGNERVAIGDFALDGSSQEAEFTLVAGERGAYTLSFDGAQAPLSGRVGEPLRARVREGALSLTVAELHALPGARFRVVRRPPALVTAELQRQLTITASRGRTGNIRVVWSDDDPVRLVNLLNEVARLYLRQNLDRKVALAGTGLRATNAEIARLKTELDGLEAAYEQFRARHGVPALDAKVRSLLGQAIDTRSLLLERQSRRIALAQRYTERHPQVAVIDAQLAAFERFAASSDRELMGLNPVALGAARFERDIGIYSERYRRLVEGAQHLRIARDGAPAVGRVQLIDGAVVPSRPMAQNPLLLALLALLAGGAAVLATLGGRAALRQWRQGRAHDPRAVEALTGLDVFMSIPLSSAQDGTGGGLLAAARPLDGAVESLRALLLVLRFALRQAPVNRLLVCGATPGVGKSFVAANLAAVAAGDGRRVLLVDADLRRGQLHQVFGLPRGNGLADAIAGAIPVDEAIRADVAPGLDLLPTGTLPPNAADLLDHAAFADLLATLSPRYDLVVLDSAPVLVGPDALSVVRHAGATLLVAREGRNLLGDVQEALRRLAQLGVRPAGIVLNAVRVEAPGWLAHWLRRPWPGKVHSGL